MAKLTDPERLAAYLRVLENGSCGGWISYTPIADAWLRGNLQKCTQLTMNKLMRDYVIRDGGEIDEVVEERENWRDQWDYHYDLRPIFRGRKLYFETRLCLRVFDPKIDPTIIVANLKWA